MIAATLCFEYGKNWSAWVCLASIAVERLPQNERDAAQRLTGGSGFLPSGVYVDGDSGLAYLDYGNPSWNTFIEAGTLSHPQMGDIPQIDVLQLAEIMISLAAQQRETGSDNGEIAASTLLYWYALLPTVMTVSGYEGQVEEERIIRLRDMAAVPEAFEQAGILWLTSELEDLADLADEDLELFRELGGAVSPVEERSGRYSGVSRLRVFRTGADGTVHCIA